MIDKIRKEYLNNYYGRAEDLSTWFNAGLMNHEVAELLLRNYNSAHKKFESWANESAQLGSEKRKGRINPHYLLLHKYILMFFGLSLECYLRGLLIKTKKLEPPTPDKKSLPLKCKKHLSIEMYNKLFGIPTASKAGTIARLRRAILAGKYPVEENITKIDAYTAYLDSDIKETKRMIEEAKQ